MIGSRVGTVNVVRVMNGGETSIVGAGTEIGTMIETVDMTGTVMETATAPMIQEVTGGPAHGLGIVLETMIVTGTSSLVYSLVTFVKFCRSFSITCYC